jgi:hypothetical protein
MIHMCEVEGAYYKRAGVLPWIFKKSKRLSQTRSKRTTFLLTFLFSLNLWVGGDGCWTYQTILKSPMFPRNNKARLNLVV